MPTTNKTADKPIPDEEAPRDLSDLIDEVVMDSEPVVFHRRGKPVAALVPIEHIERSDSSQLGSPRIQQAQAMFDRVERLGRFGHWEWDEIDRRCTYCSEGLAALVGVTVEAYLAQSASLEGDLEWIHPDDRERYREANDRANLENRGLSIVYRHLRADGTVITVQEDSTKVFNDRGFAVASHGYVQDITERVETEEALRRSETRFRDFAAAASDWFWETDADLKITWLSSRASEVSSLPKEWNYGRTRDEIIDRSVDPDGWAEHKQTLRDRKPFRDFIYKRDLTTLPDQAQSYVWTRISGNPVFDDDGVFLGYRGTGSDVTQQMLSEEALKDSEQNYRMLFENAPIAIWEADLSYIVEHIETVRRDDGRCFADFIAAHPTVVEGSLRHLRGIDVNIKGLELFGLSSKADFVEEPTRICDALADHKTDILSKLHVGAAAFSFECNVTQADGSHRDLEVTCSALPGTDRPLARTLFSAVDITQHNRAERALKESESRFKDFAESASDWFWETDAEHRFTWLSPNASKVLGVSRESTYGLTRDEMGDLSLDPEGWAEHQRVLEAHKPFRDFTYRRLPKFFPDSSVPDFWARISGNPRFSDDGTFLGYRGTASEVTKEKLAETALVKSEQRFRDFAEAASDWFWETDSEHRFNWISESFYRIKQHRPGVHIGKFRWDITVEPTDTAKWRAHKADLDAHRPIKDFRYKLRETTGEIGYRSINAVPVFGEDGAFLGYRGTAKDITGLVQTEQALKRANDEMGRRVEERTAELAASRLRLIDAIEAISEAFVLFDENERLVLCNSKYRALITGIGDILVPGKKFEDILKRVAATGQVVMDDVDGETWVRNRLTAFREASDSIEEQLADGRWMLRSNYRTRDGGVVGIRRDITTEKLAKRALDEGARRLRDIAEAASDWFWELDSDLRFTYISDRYLAVAGIPPDSLYGLRWEEVYPISAKRQRLAWQTFFDAVAAQKDFRDFVHDDFRDDGRRRVIRNTGKAIFSEEGRFLGYRGTSTDITKEVAAEEDLRRSEARLATALSQARIAYWRLALSNDHITDWAEEAADILGIPYGDLPSDTPAYMARLHPEDREAVRRCYERHLRNDSNASGYRMEYRYIRPDGEMIWISEEAALDPDHTGEISEVHGTIQDITVIKRAEEQLRQAQKMEAIGQLTGGVAHDFNNLLAIIQGNTEFLLDDSGADTDTVLAIKRAAGLGAELTQRLLAFSRQQPLRPQPIALDRLVSGMSDLLSRSLGETIEVKTTSEPELWNATADPGQVQNALLNLAINARDAMPEGGRLTIACSNARLAARDLADHPEVAPGEYVSLIVRDSGIGMSQDTLDRAFEPFFTTKDFGQGSGLGLSMVYGFARQSNGFVTLTSEPGAGTCARLCLPRDSGGKRRVNQTRATSTPSGQGESLLVIEDDDEVRRIAVKILEGLNYRVIGVPDAASAWSQIETGERIDLVLSDIVLPGGESGIAFARGLQKRHPTIGVLFMSGYPAEVIARDGLLDIGKILLNKPFKRADLATAVRRVLDHPQARVSA